MTQAQDIKNYFASLQVARPVVSGTVATVVYDSTTARQRYANVNVAGQVMRIALADNAPILSSGDAVRLEQWGSSSQADYQVLSAYGARPAAGYTQFMDVATIAGQQYDGGDVILGGYTETSPNWWFDYSEGVFYKRIGQRVMGYDRADGISVWGPPDGVHWKIDPITNKFSLNNGSTELRYFDGDTGYIVGWDGVGKPLGPGIRWGVIKEVDTNGYPVYGASGQQLERYAWRVVGANGVPAVSALSGNQDDPNDARFMIGNESADSSLVWQDGLIVRGEIQATSGSIDGDLTIGDNGSIQLLNAELNKTGLLYNVYPATGPTAQPVIKWLYNNTEITKLQGWMDSDTATRVIELTTSNPARLVYENGDIRISSVYDTSDSGSTSLQQVGLYAVTDWATSSIVIYQSAPSRSPYLSQIYLNATEIRIRSGSRITQVGDATAATDALNRQTGDGRYLLQTGVTTGATSQAQTFTNGVLAPNVTKRIFVVEGDSLSNDIGTGGDWPSYLIASNAWTGVGTLISDATAGDTIATILTQYTANIHPYRRINANDEAYFFLLAGTNDINVSTASHIIYNNLSTEWASARADGYKVIAFTIPPAEIFTVGNGKETLRLEVNAAIVANRALYDYLIRADVLFPDPTNETYFSADHLHLNATGSALLCAAVVDALCYETFHIEQATTTAGKAGYDLYLNLLGRQTRAENATDLSTFTGTTHGPLLVRSTAGTNKFAALDFGGATNDNPQARIAAVQTATGSKLYFGTSNDYAAGITNNGLIIGPSGYIGLNEVEPTARLHFAAATTAAGGILFGDDAGLYRSAAGVLSLTGDLSAGSAYIEAAAGKFYGAYLTNIESGNNALISVANNGAVISRNVADAYPALIVSILHASSTGPALRTIGGIDVRGSAIFNEDGADADFRVESDTEANMLFVDASTDRVGIGTATPTSKLDVKGVLNIRNSGADGTMAEVLRFSLAEYPDQWTNSISSSVNDGGSVSYMRFSLATGEYTRSDVLTLRGNGNVGIGTAAPDYKLHVTGSLYATSFGIGVTPVAPSTGWSVSNVSADKTFDANATTIDELADVLGTLIDYLKTTGLLGA